MTKRTEQVLLVLAIAVIAAVLYAVGDRFGAISVLLIVVLSPLLFLLPHTAKNATLAITSKREKEMSRFVTVHCLGCGIVYKMREYHLLNGLDGRHCPNSFIEIVPDDRLIGVGQPGRSGADTTMIFGDGGKPGL